MDSPTDFAKKTHPAIIVAAVAVTAASVAAIGAITGVLPTRLTRPAEPTALTAPAAAPATTAAPVASLPTSPENNDIRTANSSAAGTAPSGQPTRALPAPAPRHAHRGERRAAPTTQAREELPTLPTAAGIPGAPPSNTGGYTEPARQAAVCLDCGTVVAVREVTRQGEGTGLGAVLGGVLGGIVGHQFGKGHGNDAMTAVGAIGGAVAGNQVEKTQRATRQYEVTVRFDDGSTRTFTDTRAGTWHNGDRVRSVNGALTTS